MYAPDSRIRELLPELEFTTQFDDPGFDPDAQIQPCSVDLRVGHVFWRPARPLRLWRPGQVEEIDLRSSIQHRISPERHWSQITLESGESIRIKPGEVLLGRIYERFTIPDGYAGKIEGRSSYSRLGLMVHCTGDFINPGWTGNMPLQLVNFSRSPIRIPAFLPICQLMLVKLESDSESKYGKEGLESKYVPDTGGPSYWWRDRLVSDLHDKVSNVDFQVHMSARTLELIPEPDPAVVFRLHRFVAESKAADLENADAVIQRFAKSEDRHRLAAKVGWTAVVGMFAIIAATLLAALVTDTSGTIRLILAVLTLALAYPAMVGVQRRDVGPHFGEAELQQARLSGGG